MDNKYVVRFDETKNILAFFKQRIKDTEITEMDMDTRFMFLNAYRSYSLVKVYTVIQDILESLLADYLTGDDMPPMCKIYGNKLLKGKQNIGIDADNFHNELAKINGTWLCELNRRRSEKFQCVFDKRFNVDELYDSNESLSVSRHAFVHEGKDYTGDIDEIISMFEKGICFLYEIENVMSI